ncbi:hypothetical protein C4D60_Mb09t10420 [Musa balbisiana]|uniref:RRM domain-containing protein n=1 Tax=Musa balbisiana TaxID=52838 RepID=A0A4S8IFD9_MUSBA|nr:hypothetical protein C4D60_Mb09t10420 [Musa balbisiana]
MDEMAAAYYHPPPVAAHYPYYPQPQTHEPPPLTGAPYPPHHHHLPALAPPSRTHLSPQYYSVPADLPPRDEVRTLFIAGLPDDVKPREIYNLFHEFPGYQSAQLRRSGQSSQAYAFTVFTDQQSALSAMRALNMMVYLILTIKELEDLLHIQEAFQILNNSTYTPQSNPPCPTLFVANLGPKCSEQDLYKLAFVCRCPGFLKLKMQNKNGVPVAFIDFQDTSSSTGALNHLQGTILYSSVGEGMRLEYPL